MRCIIRRSARTSFATTSPFLGLRHGVSSSSIHLPSFLAPCSKHYLNTLCNTQREQVLLSLTCRISLSHYLSGQFFLVFPNPDGTLAHVLLYTLSTLCVRFFHRPPILLWGSLCTLSFYTLNVYEYRRSAEGVLAQGYKVQCTQGPPPSCPPEQIRSLRTESWLVSSSLYLLTCISHDS